MSMLESGTGNGARAHIEAHMRLEHGPVQPVGARATRIISDTVY